MSYSHKMFSSQKNKIIKKSKYAFVEKVHTAYEEQPYPPRTQIPICFQKGRALITVNIIF